MYDAAKSRLIAAAYCLPSHVLSITYNKLIALNTMYIHMLSCCMYAHIHYYSFFKKKDIGPSSLISELLSTIECVGEADVVDRNERLRGTRPASFYKNPPADVGAAGSAAERARGGNVSRHGSALSAVDDESLATIHAGAGA
jgi:hypothetical protein